MVYGYIYISVMENDALAGRAEDEQRNRLMNAGAEYIRSDVFDSSRTKVPEDIKSLLKSSRKKWLSDIFDISSRKRQPDLIRLMTVLQKHDTVIVASLDRIAHTKVLCIRLLEYFEQHDITLKCLDNSIVFDGSQKGTAARQWISKELRRSTDRFQERMTFGKEISRKNNPDYREGRPPKVYGKKEKDRII